MAVFPKMDMHPGRMTIILEQIFKLELWLMNKTTDFTKKISNLIRNRYSCRTYSGVQIESGTLKLLVNYSDRCQEGPFGFGSRFVSEAGKVHQVGPSDHFPVTADLKLVR